MHRQSILQRARTNNLGAMEAVIWAYAWGKPKERLELKVAIGEDLAGLNTVELLERADELRASLLEAAAMEASVPAEFRVENDEP